MNLLRRAYQAFTSVPPVFIDGLLYVMIAVFGAMVASFNAEEAYKYINPYVLYWLKHTATWGLAIATALKMYRSTSYSRHLDKKEQESNTEIFRRSQGQGPTP